MDKLWPGPADAVADIPDGATIMVGGFGDSGFPHALVAALAQKRPRDLTIIHNGAAFGSLVTEGRIRRLICSYPVGPSSLAVLPAIEAGALELEVIPQGSLVERIRAGGAGLGGVLTPVGLDLEHLADAPTLEVGGRRYMLLAPLRADFALLRGDTADRIGNVRCRKAARNFNPVMATAANTTIVEVGRCVDTGELEPEDVHIPAPFVDRVVLAPLVRPAVTA